MRVNSSDPVKMVSPVIKLSNQFTPVVALSGRCSSILIPLTGLSLYLMLNWRSSSLIINPLNSASCPVVKGWLRGDRAGSYLCEALFHFSAWQVNIKEVFCSDVILLPKLLYKHTLGGLNPPVGGHP